MQKGFVPLVFVLIIGVLSAGIVGGVWYYKSLKIINLNHPPEVERQNNTAVVKDETEDWKTFKTSDFSLKYPPEMKSSLFQGEYILELWGPTQRENTEFYDGINLGVTIGDLNDQTLEEVASKAQMESKKNLDPEPVSEILANDVAGYQGYGYTERGLGTMQYIFVSNGTDKYAKIRYLLDTDPQNRGYQKMIDQILSTFRFVEDTSEELPFGVNVPETWQFKKDNNVYYYQSDRLYGARLTIMKSGRSKEDLDIEYFNQVHGELKTRDLILGKAKAREYYGCIGVEGCNEIFVIIAILNGDQYEVVYEPNMEQDLGIYRSIISSLKFK